ncbi:MAG: SusC/RagA family TonB-linked outer membrane protein [Balneolaceae bacterium]|nr:SusC/RagA family TonB-linked outer membrane protein [Balneolaceae bacterium]MCH8547978.1 SusC/RagA family TonB-linked outer membrane protein [Balneolaceae bacterium]
MQKTILFAVTVLAFLFTAINSNAQTTLNGEVIDSNTREPLFGVSVLDMNTGTGTSTDLEGEFTITFTGSTTLRFSYIGYRVKDVEVTPQTTTLRVELEQEVSALDELVVTGLATTVKRSNLANAVSSISARQIAENVDPQTLDRALQGKIAGVNIIQTSGAPGGGFNVQLRGISTLGAGASQPLYIVDGVYVDNSILTTGRSLVSGAGGTVQDDSANRIADLNPEDIESIEVLKGSSAAAIYGQRANAGVIIINTKRGRSGRTNISVKQDVGFNSAQRLLGRTDWTEERIDAFYGAGSARAELERSRLVTARQNGNIRDLERELYGENGLIRNTQLSISGGDDRTRFYVSGALNSEDGIIKNTGNDRQSLRVNLDHNIRPTIRISSNSNFVSNDQQRGFTGNQNNTGGSIGYTLAYTPNYAYDILRRQSDGSYNDNPYFAENPFRLRDVAQNEQLIRRFVQSFQVNADLWQRNSAILSVNAQAGFDYMNSKSTIYFPEFMQFQRNLPLPGDVISTRQEVLNSNLQALLLYTVSLDNFDLTTQAGFSRFAIETQLDRVRGQGLLPGQINIENAANRTVTQNFTESTDFGYFAQQEVNWADRIIGTVGARLDRSTLNLDQDQFYFFPKASLAVNLTNFDFWTSDRFDQFKLRAAYGETGGTPNFGAIFSSLGSASFAGQVGVVAPTTSVDPDLKPETAREIESGLDVTFFNGRLTFEGTYYRKEVQDLILGLATAPATGVTNVLTNAADLTNKGFELGLSGRPIQRSNFNWDTRLLWWNNKSEVTNLSIPAQTNQALGNIAFGAIRIQEGVSPTAILGAPVGTDGPGGLTVYGDYQPDFQMSLSNEFTIAQNWSIGFLLHWSQGGNNINLSELLGDFGGNSKDYFLTGTELNPRLSEGLITSRFVEDTSYLKMREASIYYTVPIRLLRPIAGDNIRRFRVGASGNNLFTITNYGGYDPEVNFAGRNILNQSVDITPYPTARRILFHVQIDL